MYGMKAVRDLYDEYLDCSKCSLLCASRSRVVFGSGSVNADILIVGEAPGTEENSSGIPFTGGSGRLLLQLLDMASPATEALEKIRGLEDNEEYFTQIRDYFEEKVFFTNVVLCMPDDGRTPSTEEIKNCKSRLERTIYAVDPKVIIAAGKTAASVVLGKKVSVQSRRGEILDISISSPATGRKVRYPMLVLLHPSFLLRKGDMPLVTKKKGDTYKTLQDLKYIMSLIDTYETITEKAL